MTDTSGAESSQASAVAIEGGRRMSVEARRSGSVWSLDVARLAADHGDDHEQVPLVEDRFINRELSWLEFGARLLNLASDDRIPLFERVKFLALFSEALDEFFQVRVAGLEDQVAAGLRTRSPDGMSPLQTLQAITVRVGELVERQSRIFADQLAPALAGAGVVMSDWETLDHDDRA